MSTPTPKTRRWIKSAIATASEKAPALPFQRGNRRRPVAFSAPVAAVRPGAIAAR